MWFPSPLSLVGLILIALTLAIYRYREQIIPLLPRQIRSRIQSYAPLPLFEDAQRAGLSTSTFDLEANIRDDQRSGLDQVRRLMDRHNISFDEARLRRQHAIFKANGIDPLTGLPLDAKAITSLS